jgi:hypothetical protein
MTGVRFKVKYTGDANSLYDQTRTWQYENDMRLLQRIMAGTLFYSLFYDAVIRSDYIELNDG